MGQLTLFNDDIIIFCSFLFFIYVVYINHLQRCKDVLPPYHQLAVVLMESCFVPHQDQSQEGFACHFFILYFYRYMRKIPIFIKGQLHTIMLKNGSTNRLEQYSILSSQSSSNIYFLPLSVLHNFQTNWNLIFH